MTDRSEFRSAALRGTRAAEAVRALLLLAAVPALLLAGAGQALAQLSDDARTSTQGTQFVRPPPRPQPPPPQAPPPPAPAPEPQAAPAAVTPPAPPPPPPPPRYPSVVFLVDTSDSMLNRVAPGAERTRLDEAKDALAQVLRDMAADTRVQVWSFNTHLTPVLVPGVPERRFIPIGKGGYRAQLIASVKQFHTAGGTNLYQSVHKALGLFADPRDQMAYRSGLRFPVLVVLSDGEDGGKTRETLETVQAEKGRYPLVTVNTIGFKLAGDQAWFDVLCRIATRKDGCATADDETQLRQMLDSFYRFRKSG